MMICHYYNEKLQIMRKESSRGKKIEQGSEDEVVEPLRQGKRTFFVDEVLLVLLRISDGVDYR